MRKSLKPQKTHNKQKIKTYIILGYENSTS